MFLHVSPPEMCTAAAWSYEAMIFFFFLRGGEGGAGNTVKEELSEKLSCSNAVCPSLCFAGASLYNGLLPVFLRTS